MREIKFRAWNPNWDEMVYSTLETVFDKREFYSFGFEVGFSHYPEEGWIIAQYTGLKDKNGIEIYEGDIVNMHYFFENYDRETLGAFEDETEVVGVVRIDEMSVYTDCKEGRFDWLNYLEEPTEELEVIGNIYDNPELLEVSE
jgi:uncharacterized phage protein (TIGR01671 family)